MDFKIIVDIGKCACVCLKNILKISKSFVSYLCFSAKVMMISVFEKLLIIKLHVNTLVTAAPTTYHINYGNCIDCLITVNGFFSSYAFRSMRGANLIKGHNKLCFVTTSGQCVYVIDDKILIAISLASKSFAGNKNIFYEVGIIQQSKKCFFYDTLFNFFI